MRQWSKRIIGGMLSLFLVGTLVLTGCSGAKKTVEKKPSQAQGGQAQQFQPLSTTSKTVVAEYNGGKITEGDLNLFTNIYSFLDPQLAMMLSDPKIKPQMNEVRKQLAERYASELYVANKIKREAEFQKRADERMKQLDDSIKKFPSKAGTPKSLDEAIKGKGFNKEELRAFLTRIEQVLGYYDEQLKGQTYNQVKVDHILIAINGQPKRTDAEASKLAQEVKKKLDSGGDFAKLAKQYSDDPGSKDKGGLIEGPADSFVPEFANAVKTLPLNKISDPVKTNYGYHIIKVLERTQESLDKAPEEVKAQKRQELHDKLVKDELQFKYLVPEPKK